MNILLIDDIRTIRQAKHFLSEFLFSGFSKEAFYLEKFSVARTFEEGLEKIKEMTWDIVILDNDLGNKDNAHKDGYDILCWLEEHQEFLPQRIVLITQNPAAKQKMQMVINKLYA